VSVTTAAPTFREGEHRRSRRRTPCRSPHADGFLYWLVSGAAPRSSLPVRLAKAPLPPHVSRGRRSPGLPNVILTLAFTTWVTYARVVRGQVLSLREKEFITAARCVGVSDFATMVRHILPNTLAPVIVIASFAVANTMLAEAALSFLGLSVGAGCPNVGWYGRRRARPDHHRPVVDLRVPDWWRCTTCSPRCPSHTATRPTETRQPGLRAVGEILASVGLLLHQDEPVAGVVAQDGLDAVRPVSRLLNERNALRSEFGEGRLAVVGRQADGA
jgi:Binding-protein-dependent transport system inner membrane component